MKHAFQDHTQWPAVKAACEKLTEAGFRTYLAGGCVRDFLMKRRPHDFDIATQATPEQVEALFPNSLMVGRAFGVSIIPIDGFQLEIATFRKDGEYQDGRHPDGVFFCDDVEDAKRRDFSVNALFYDLVSEKVIDHVGGIPDLELKVLRAVGEPARRFEEDKLRLLRAVRFAAQLDFEIEPATWREVVRLSSEIGVVSRERVRDEIIKLLSVTARRRGIDLLRVSGLLATLFPELGSALDEEEFSENFDITFEILEREFQNPNSSLAVSAVQNQLRERPSLWLTFLFMNYIGPQGAHALTSDQQFDLLNSLKIDNQNRDGIVWIWKQLSSVQTPDSLAILGRVKLLMSPWWGFTYSLCCVLNSHMASEERDTTWRETIELFERQGGVLGQKITPWITGKDLQACGIMPGVKMGRILDQALQAQMTGEWASREEGLEWLREFEN